VLGFAVLLGALAFAGAGGGQNLVQSNWIRDKGFRTEGEVQPEAAPSTGSSRPRSASWTTPAGWPPTC
jgi:hypothetical protein